MVEENRGDQGQQGTQQPQGPIAQPTPIPPLVPIIPPPIPPVAAGETASGNPADPQRAEDTHPPDEELKFFERETLRLSQDSITIGRNTARLAFWGILIAALTGFLFYAQLSYISDQTQLLASQAEGEAVSAALSGVQTQKLLVTIEEQAKRTKEIAERTLTQANATHDLSDLARQVAKLVYGAARLSLGDWTPVYHTERDKRVWIEVRTQNDGKSDAKDVYMAVSLRFLPSVPKIYPEDFKRVDPITLIPSATGRAPIKEYGEKIPLEKYPAYKSQKLYVWGQIRYTDFAGETTTIRFCRYVLGKDVFDAPEGPPPKGYGGIFEKCDQQTATDRQRENPN